MGKFWIKVGWEMACGWWKSATIVEAVRGVLIFLLTASVPAWGRGMDQWPLWVWFIPVTLVVIWFTMRCIYQVHASAPSGAVVSYLKRAIRNKALIGNEIKPPKYSYDDAMIWQEGVESLLRRALGDVGVLLYEQHYRAIPPGCGFNVEHMQKSCHYLMKLADELDAHDIQRGFNIYSEQSIENKS